MQLYYCLSLEFNFVLKLSFEVNLVSFSLVLNFVCSLKPLVVHCVKFHVIFCCGNNVEKHNFCRVSGKTLETQQKLHLSAKFPPQKNR